MRKRRVLALLLALSLVVSGNGMTVLAAEQGADMSVLASQEDTEETAPEEDTSDGTENTSVEDVPETEDKSDGAETPEEGDTTTEEGETGEEETPENPDESDPSAPKEDDTEQGGDQPSAGDDEQNGEQPSTEDGTQDEEPDVEEQEPTTEVQEPSVSGNDVDETEEPEEESEVKTGEVRMMTFTDASGLRITFDANAAEENAEKATIVDGVLTGIDENVEGVVDLRKESFTEIGEGAFQGKAKVTYVMLPKTVTNIGKNGFLGCAALKGISIPSRLVTIGEAAFQDCARLTQLAVPNSVVSIGANAFKDDKRLFMVNMASADYAKLTSIGDSAFEGCSALEFFCSDDDYDLPDSLKTIGANAFKNCSSIVEVDMPDGITSLGESAYQGCTGILEVEISTDIGTIPGYAFAGCTNLIEIEFKTRVRAPKTTIESMAFENCTKLMSVELPQKVECVKANAFKGCTALLRIHVKCDAAELEPGAFPDENEGLCILGSKGSAAEEYAGESIRFIPDDEVGRKDYYKYEKKLTEPMKDGEIKLTVTKELSASAKDINTIINADGVAPNNVGVLAGTDCYVMINLGKYAAQNGQDAVVRLVPGTLKCNGEEIACDRSRGTYSFKMPKGGAMITAEFERTKPINIVEGNKDTIEGRLSADVNYDYENKTAYMLEGQTAKFYLINEYEGQFSRIPTSKITYSIAKDSPRGVVSVDAEGEVKALKEGTARVEATVSTEGGEVTKHVIVVVKKTTGIDRITISLDKDVYSEVNVTVDKDKDEVIQGVSLPTSKVSSKEYDFDIEAAAFSADNDESLNVAFTWTSSDTKVARVKKASTQAGASENEIIIPRGADGEATITISATGTDKQKVSQKFIVSVRNYSPRLTASKITVNPKQDNGSTTIGIIDAYEREVDNTSRIEVYENGNNGREITGFIFKFVEKTGLVSTYSVEAVGIAQKTYNVKLRVKVKIDGRPIQYETPLTIVVKESEPNPTVSFNKKDPKINLFLANDGVEIQPVIGKLGDHKVSGYSLEPLTAVGHKNYEDDKLFIENFQIDAQTGTITQKAPNLKKSNNGKGKPVLTGYLVLKFEGFGDLTKKYKITIPTQTVAPAYVLDKTSGTFGTDTPQPIELTLLDKKTKKPIAWDGDYKLVKGADSTCDEAKPALIERTGVIDGVEQKIVKIQVNFDPNPIKGKLCMILTNAKWAEGKSFTYTYTVKTDAKPAQIKLKKSTVTLNTNYPKNKAEFELVSNHEDTVFAKEYEFAPLANKANEKILGKLTVKCTDGKGEVFFGKADTTDYSFVGDIPAGNYKYQAVYQDKNGQEKKIALTVKIVRTTPAVTLKGTNSLNLKAWTNNKEGTRTYVEVSEMSVTVKNLPDVEKWLDKPGDGGNDSSTETPGGGTETPGGGTTGGEGGSGTPGDTGNTDGDNTDTQPQQISAASEGTVSGGKINPAYYLFDAKTTFDGMQFTTKGCESWNPQEYFTFEWVDGEKASEGKIRISLKKEMPAKTYTLKMTPTYSNGINPKPVQTAKAVSFKIKVYSGDITVTLKAKGKINLLNREVVEKNGIQYTPTFKNLKDTIKEVRLLDVNDGIQATYDQPERISKQFTPIIAEDGKSFYIVPTSKAELENKKSYRLRVWIKTKGYEFPGTSTGGGTYVRDNIKVTTAEILPKVKTDQTTANLYLSSKAYEATFIVQKSDEKSIGAIEKIAFGEKDEKANDSFEVWGETQEDGSLKVHLKLKNGVTYGCNTTNKIKMYIQFTGQGTNTAGTPITMNVKINK